MRYHMTEKALGIIASRISREITIRQYVDGNSEDITRDATASEEETLFKIAYGALLGLNYGETVRSNSQSEQAILDSSEFTLHLFLRDSNTYDTLYNKLRAVLEAWKAHERKPSEWSFRMILRMFPEEMQCLDDWLAYADDTLETITSEEDAIIQAEGMKQTLEDDDEIFPEELGDPHILMMLWNLFVKTPNAIET